MIQVIVDGQRVKKIITPTVASDTIDYLEAEFVFSADWDAFPDKKAVFTKGDVMYAILLQDDKITRDKHLNLDAGYWYVSVVGSRFENGETVSRITTTSHYFDVRKAGGVDGLPLPEVPPSYGEQIEAIAQEALTKAEQALAGGGSGGSGFELGHALEWDKSGKLAVQVADKPEADNTLPITAAAVQSTVGNIEVLLSTI